MREVTFLNNHHKKWEEFETLLSSSDAPDPNKLTELFVELTDDLSYAQTFFPSSKTTQYLNGLTAKVHQSIYKNRREERSRIILFWKYEVPLAIRAAHRHLLVALVLFLIAASIGAVSSVFDKRFVRSILGDGYVNTTIENIRRGDPMAVYKKSEQVDMFSRIWFNNVRVAFYAFAGGMSLCIVTLYIVFSNGIMVGAFQAMFAEYGLLWKSFLVIWIHGSLEIPCIIMAAGAGLTFGSSLIFPGTFSRREAFKQSAKRGVKILVGLVPLIILAAVYESFVTRYTDMPEFISVAIIAMSLSFCVWYFIVYPIRIERKLRHESI